MSVSRVEYDAALKRVQAKVCALSSTADVARCAGKGADHCECVTLTLAALGLDEPPTEEAKPVHTQECEDRAFIFHASTGGDAPCICGAVPPPTEPPKAWSDGYGLGVSGGRGFVVVHRAGAAGCGLTPDDARAMAAALIEHADHIEPPAEPPKADEPPTEAPRTYTCECCEEQTTRPYVHPVEGIDLCAPCVASLPREGDVPPAETPKACPTCGSGWTYHHACPDRGSGIDGGTT